jgi:hypothetical protein
MLENHDVAVWLSILELEVHDAKSLFEILDVDCNGLVSYDEFLTGVMRLKGLHSGQTITGLIGFGVGLNPVLYQHLLIWMDQSIGFGGSTGTNQTISLDQVPLRIAISLILYISCIVHRIKHLAELITLSKI